MSYYNTTNLDNKELKERKKKALNQDEKVLNIFKYNYEHSGIGITPIDAMYSYSIIHGEVPLTSIRRSINTLTKKGLLIKTDEKILEMYGAYNYKWKLNEQEAK